MSLANARNASHRHQVEVTLKSEYTDVAGESALGFLRSLGVNTAREVRSSRLYEILGNLTAAQVHQAARDLLCDPVTEEFRLVSAGVPVMNGMNHWRVELWLKTSVTDPVGLTVSAAFTEMGLPKPECVRVGTAYHIVGKCGRHQLEKAVAKSLANPVIHNFTVAEATQ